MTALLLSLLVYGIGTAICYGWCLADPRWSRQDALWFSWGWPLWLVSLVLVAPFVWIANVTRQYAAQRRLERAYPRARTIRKDAMR